MNLRERISYMAEYGNFLRTLFPVFKTLLLERIPVSFRDDDSNRFRRIVLEILNWLLNKILYNQQVLRPYTLELLDLATQTLSTDNEENALTCCTSYSTSQELPFGRVHALQAAARGRG